MGRLIVFSGAGLSAESGIATFRGADGRWNGIDPMVVANYLTFQEPEARRVAIPFYNRRRLEVGNAQPNAAHRLIADWQQRYETVLLTQNVDDLLERAGCNDVVHLHGIIREMHCTACGHVWDIGYAEFSEDGCCPLHRCGATREVKPNVVLFNQEAPLYRTLYTTMRSLTRDDVVLVTGTSGQVIDIASHLFDRSSYNIFNALEMPASVCAYNATFIKPATVAFPDIDRVLRERLG